MNEYERIETNSKFVKSSRNTRKKIIWNWNNDTLKIHTKWATDDETKVQLKRRKQKHATVYDVCECV